MCNANGVDFLRLSLTGSTRDLKQDTVPGVIGENPGMVLDTGANTLDDVYGANTATGGSPVGAMPATDADVKPTDITSIPAADGTDV